MKNFEELLENDCSRNDQEKVDEYLLKTFTKENFEEYYIDPDANKDEEKAIRIMFESKKDLKKRVEEAFKNDPFCLEAFFAYYMKSDDTFLYLRFETYYSEANNFADLDKYEQKCFIRIMEFYVDFLFEIGNLTKAIKVQKLLIKLTNNPNRYLEQLVDLYFIIEDVDEMYRLYCENDFSVREYILLLVTELKHEDEMKAQEVLKDMLSTYKLADYLDHIWDLKDEVKEEKEFYDIIDMCFEDMITIPDFFSWVAEAKKKIGK